MRRLSVNENDPGFPFWLQSLRDEDFLRVFLNGCRLDRCITADEEMGMVEYSPKDARGEVVIDSSTGEMKRVTEYGQVRIAFQSELDATARSEG